MSNWLDCEERAETSHNIGSELLCCARLARKNDHDLFARFVSGFYKATNSESAAVHYFEKTDLIQTLLDSLNLENGHCQTLIGQGIRFMSNLGGMIMAIFYYADHIETSDTAPQISLVTLF